MKRFKVVGEHAHFNVIDTFADNIPVYESRFESQCKVERDRLEAESNAPHLVEITGLGGARGRRVNVRFTSWRKVYDACVVNRESVVTLHRVTQVAGGRAVGGTIDAYRSVSKNHPDFESLAAIALGFAINAKEQA